MRNKVKVMCSHYLHIYQPHRPTVRGKDCSKRPGFKTSSVRLGSVMRRSTLGFFSGYFVFSKTTVKLIDNKINRLKHQEKRTQEYVIWYILLHDNVNSVTMLWCFNFIYHNVVGFNKVLKCDVIKMTFLKLWDL